MLRADCEALRPALSDPCDASCCSSGMVAIECSSARSSLSSSAAPADIDEVGAAGTCCSRERERAWRWGERDWPEGAKPSSSSSEPMNGDRKGLWLPSPASTACADGSAKMCKARLACPLARRPRSLELKPAYRRKKRWMAREAATVRDSAMERLRWCWAAATAEAAPAPKMSTPITEPSSLRLKVRLTGLSVPVPRGRAAEVGSKSARDICSRRAAGRDKDDASCTSSFGSSSSKPEASLRLLRRLEPRHAEREVHARVALRQRVGHQGAHALVVMPLALARQLVV